MSLIDRIAPFITPAADVAGSLRSLSNSIQEQNRTDAELRNQRELRDAQLAQSERAVQAENDRALATIMAANSRQQAEFDEKKREQQSNAVKDFTSTALSSDATPAQILAQAPYLKTHGVELAWDQPERSQEPLPALPSTNLSLGMKSPAVNALSPGPLAAPPPMMAPILPEKEPTVVKLRTKSGEELGSIDLGSIGEERKKALTPVFQAILENAAPLEAPAYRQQIEAVQSSPALMALGAPALLTRINEGSKTSIHEAAANERARMMAEAQEGKLKTKAEPFDVLVSGMENNPDIRAHFRDGGAMYKARLQINPRSVTQATDAIAANNRALDATNRLKEIDREWKALGLVKYAPTDRVSSWIVEQLNNSTPGSREYVEYHKAADLQSEFSALLKEIHGVKAAIAKTAGSEGERKEAAAEDPTLGNYTTADKLDGTQRMLRINTAANLALLNMVPDNAPPSSSEYKAPKVTPSGRPRKPIPGAEAAIEGDDEAKANALLEGH